MNSKKRDGIDRHKVCGFLECGIESNADLSEM